jgi:hypothetical protein
MLLFSLLSPQENILASYGTAGWPCTAGLPHEGFFEHVKFFTRKALFFYQLGS